MPQAASPSPRARPGFASRQARSSSSSAGRPSASRGCRGSTAWTCASRARTAGRTRQAGRRALDRRGGARRRAGARARRARGRSRRSSFLGFEVEVEAVAGSAEVGARLSHREPRAGRTTGVAAWELVLRLAGSEAAATCGAFDAVHRTRGPFTIRHRGDGYARGIFPVSELVSESDWEDACDPGYRERWEWSELSGRHVSNWIGVEGSIAVVVPQFADTHPSDLGFAAGSVRVGLWPADAGRAGADPGHGAVRPAGGSRRARGRRAAALRRPARGAPRARAGGAARGRRAPFRRSWRATSSASRTSSRTSARRCSRGTSSARQPGSSTGATASRSAPGPAPGSRPTTSTTRSTRSA